MSLGRILVVEDDSDLRNVCQIILRHAGYDVCAAANGKEGLSELTKCEPQLVLLDIFMHVMDGKTFLQSAGLTQDDTPKVVVYSNTSDQALMDDMLQLGADQVVNKSSLAPNDLINLVKPYFAH